MDAAVERRDGGGSRIPLDSRVELSHEGFAERFEADGVNVSEGGISMRASYLPHVGARLRCRFPGARGALVEAGAEVVWSSDKGPHTGEFGLRFLDLGDEAASAIRLLLQGRAYVPPSPGAGKSEEDTIDQPPDPAPVSLAVEGLSSIIRGGIVSEDDHVLTVSQELPLLRLKTGVTVQKDGRRGLIEGIELRMDGETPRLLIDIVFDDSLPQDVAEATIPDLVTELPPVDDTAVDVSAPADPLEDDDDDEIEAAFAAMPALDSGPRIIRIPSRMADVPTLESETGAPSSIDEALSAIVAESETEADAAVTAVGSEIQNGTLVARAASAIRFRVASLRPQIEKLLARLGPLFVVFAQKLKWGWAELRERGLPKAFARVHRAGGLLARAAAVVSDKMPAFARRSKRRRKTAPPPSDSNVAARFRGRHRRKEAERPEKRKRRTLVVSGVAFVGVALAVWALTPGDETVDAEDPLAGHQSIVVQANQVPQPAPAMVGPVATAPAALDDAHAVTAAVTEPAMPRALGEAPRQAGPMPAPTFPSLREGARPEAALPEGSPYAVDVRASGAQAAPAAAATSGSLFGAPEVDNGRSYLIRMSQPVTVVRGTPRGDGFTVTVPNSLSLDRAGPIAASHPLVERSMILNRGDHAELTVTFVEGRSPAYRVSARGSAIEVVIARR